MSCSGYNPNTVAEGMYSILAGLMDVGFDIHEKYQLEHYGSKIKTVEKTIEELATHLKKYWIL